MLTDIYASERAMNDGPEHENIITRSNASSAHVDSLSRRNNQGLMVKGIRDSKVSAPGKSKMLTNILCFQQA